LPFIVRLLGPERTGILSLVWVIFGYFSILDLGLGPAVIKTVSESLRYGQETRIAPIFWSAQTAQLFLGAAGGFLLYMATPFLVQRLLHVPAGFYQEARSSLILAALAMPVVLLSSSAIGMLQAAQRFGITTAIQAPMAVLQYVLTLLCALWTPRLQVVVAVLLATRFISLVLALIFVHRIFPRLAKTVSFNLGIFRGLLAFGGWITVSSVISPLLVYVDRFLLGALVSLSAITYYAVPMDAALKLVIIPSSLVVALFPVFGGMDRNRDRTRLVYLLVRSAKILLIVVGIPAIILIVYARDLLGMWMGTKFAIEGGLCLQIVLVGTLCNSMARVPSALLQGLGRPDIPSKIHLIELPLYILAAWFLILNWGIPGAAVAWTLRMFGDMVALYIFAGRALRISTRAIISEKIPTIAALIGILGLSGIAILHFLPQTAPKLLLGGVMLIAGYLLSSRFLKPEQILRRFLCGTTPDNLKP
jgi:O-antigen/teichoic acid export membrane protein